MYNDFLYRKVDNSGLVLFRIFFGLFIMLECWGAIFTGWVATNFVEPTMTFSFIGFEWTNIFLGQNMLYLYGGMGFLGLMIALGFLYRFSTFLFALLWTLTYLMQKTSYNNHYYLFLLVSWVMVFAPAHRFFSLDCIIFSKIKSNKCSMWVYYFFIGQMAIMYFFAAINKIYPDWFNGEFLLPSFEKVGNYLKYDLSFDILGDFVGSLAFTKAIAIAGFLFDLLIVPIMLIPKLRRFGLVMALFFHLFNSAVFQIGIFPYFSLAMMIFFFPVGWFQEQIFPKKSYLLERIEPKDGQATRKMVFRYAFVLYFLWQIYLPIRHHFIPGNVLWTEEGHRMAWRMMLRSKSGDITFYVENKKGERKIIPIGQYLTAKQIGKMAVSPDMIWQFAHILKDKLDPERKEELKIFAQSFVSVNRSDYYPFIDEKVDLANEKWSYFGHQSWILPQPKELHLSYFE